MGGGARVEKPKGKRIIVEGLEGGQTEKIHCLLLAWSILYVPTSWDIAC